VKDLISLIEEANPDPTRKHGSLLDKPTTSLPYVKGSETSREAALLKRGTAAIDRERVFAYIERQGEKGATDEEIATALNISGNTERPRRGELEKDKRIKKTNMQRRTRSGRLAGVYATPQTTVTTKEETK